MSDYAGPRGREFSTSTTVTVAYSNTLGETPFVGFLKTWSKSPYRNDSPPPHTHVTTEKKKRLTAFIHGPDVR